jgi:hypothetical protein
MNMTTPSLRSRKLAAACRRHLERLTKSCAWVLAFSVAMLWTGCAAIPSAPVQKSRVLSEVALVGKVVMVNSTARFVVLTFPLGQLPASGQSLDIYRARLKVGEVKVGARQREGSIVADITAGDCQIGDEAWTR